MQRTIRIRLLMLFTIALIGTVTHLAAQAPTASVKDSPVTALASRGEKAVQIQTVDDDCTSSVTAQRLCKTLDALEKAEKALGFAMDEIAARKVLNDLKNELIAVKDLYIADVLADNAFLRKANQPTVKSKIRKILETAEKILLVAAGIYLGRH